MVKLTTQMILVFLGVTNFALYGCVSKLVSAPGITGRFLDDSTGLPIADTLVRYTNVGDDVFKESRTDANGRFQFQPEFTFGYTGFPVVPVKLQVILELRNREKHNFSSGGYFLSNRDVDVAIIEAGDIRVNKIFLTP